MCVCVCVCVHGGEGGGGVVESVNPIVKRTEEIFTPDLFLSSSLDTCSYRRYLFVLEKGSSMSFDYVWGYIVFLMAMCVIIMAKPIEEDKASSTTAAI